MAVWVTPAQARVEWPDAGTNDLRLADNLAAAQEQCAAFLPDAEAEAYDLAPATVPQRVVQAVILQARENRNAISSDGSSDVIGVGDFAIRRRPLTMAVRQLLRPKRAIGPVG